MQIVVKSFYGCICVVHIDKKLSALTKKQWIGPMTVTFKCLQRTEHTVDETNPGHLTVNQSEPSYSATKMHLFVLLALEH